MRQQRVPMAEFDRNALLQYHQQAITQALTPQHLLKQIPCQLVFPDDTMALGSPACGAIFGGEQESSQGTEEERQQRLLQNEPIVVLASLSPLNVLRPEITWRSVGLFSAIALQVFCCVWILAGRARRSDLFRDDGSELPDQAQVWLYSWLLALHILAPVSICCWSPDLLKLYSVCVTATFILILTITLRCPFDLLASVVCLPIVLLANCIRDLMMPHCFTVRGEVV
eukprot:TRINITY_DN2252_c0_g1_i1.p1 TRINITY_DN2252_c0_g1~~TRINITY_DN2252_c0_g1_i1.p1  ORF type:complete len:227 (+),score=36.53 TRINITY_DN2252_c0_g1_i1:104-784(+)